MCLLLAIFIIELWLGLVHGPTLSEAGSSRVTLITKCHGRLEYHINRRQDKDG
jgi:hypothetical protein